MMMVRWLIALALLAPVAAADGLTTRVNYGDESDGCYGHSYNNETYGPGWWGRSAGWSSSCYDHFEYAGASAWTDDGKGAGARAYSTENDHHSGSYSENASYWSSNSSSTGDWRYRDARSHSDSWSRGASVSTDAASADASHGCASSSHSSDQAKSQSSSWKYGDSVYRSDSGSHTASDSRSHGCAQSATASAAGESVGARHVDGCRDSWYSRGDWQSSAYNESGTDASWHEGGSMSDCGSRVGVVSPATAAAGFSSSCSTSSFGYEESWWSTGGNGTYDSQGFSYDRAECREGAFAEGPDGMTFFAGRDYWSSSWCDTTGDCLGSTWESYGVEFAWEHNPAGPHPVSVFVPTSILPSPSMPALP